MTDDLAEGPEPGEGVATSWAQADADEAIADAGPQRWPGDPAGVWAQTRDGDHGQARLDRRRPLPTADDIELSVDAMIPTGQYRIGAVVYGALAVGLGIGAVFGNELPMPEPWGIVVRAAQAVVAAAGALAELRRGPAREEYRRVELLVGVLERGVLCDLSDCSLTLPTQSAGQMHPGLIRLLIDVTTPDDRAERIRRAVDAWTDGLGIEGSARAAATWAGYGPRTNAYSTAEIFGPGAEGGYLVRGRLIDAPWAVLVPPEPPVFIDAPHRDAPAYAVLAQSTAPELDDDTA